MKDTPAISQPRQATSAALKFTTAFTGILIIAYAFSLSLPITIPWTILILGLVVMIAHFVITAQAPALHLKNHDESSCANDGTTISEKTVGARFTEPVRSDVIRQNVGAGVSPPIRSGDIRWNVQDRRTWAHLHAPLRAPLTKPIIIFAIAVLLSGLANGGFPEAFKSFCSLRGMLVYFWAYWAFNSNPNLKRLSVSTMLIAGAIAGLWATIEQLTGFHPFSFAYLQGTGFLSAPMAFSGLTQIFSLLALGIALKNGYRDLPGKLSSPPIFYFILACNWLGLIFAAERSAWLGAFVALFITCLLVSRRHSIISGISIMIGSVIAWLVLPMVRVRLSSLMNWQHDVSVSTRITLWQKAWETFQHSPTFGVGIRQFPHMYIPEALRQGHLALDHAHSNYLHILATTGIVGLSAYLYLWFSALKVSYTEQKDSDHNNIVGVAAIDPRTRQTRLDRGIYLGIFAGIVSLAVSGLFEYNFGTAQVRLAQWFLLAMLASLI